MMKKLLSLLMVFVMVLGGAALAEAAVDYTGYWVLTAVEVAGAAVDPAVLGYNAYMDIYANGFCRMVINDQVDNGSWAATENGIEATNEAGQAEAFTLVDGMLVFEMDGSKLIFAKEAHTEPLQGLAVADFNGKWVFSYLEYLGAAYGAEEVGVDMTITLSDGKGSLEMTYAEGTEAYEADCVLVEYPDFGSVLFFLYLDENGEQIGDGMALLKFDNNELVWYYVDEYDNDVFQCFVLETPVEQ